MSSWLSSMDTLISDSHILGPRDAAPPEVDPNIETINMGPQFRCPGINIIPSLSTLIAHHQRRSLAMHGRIPCLCLLLESIIVALFVSSKFSHTTRQKSFHLPARTSYPTHHGIGHYYPPLCQAFYFRHYCVLMHPHLASHISLR